MIWEVDVVVAVLNQSAAEGLDQEPTYSMIRCILLILIAPYYRISGISYRKSCRPDRIAHAQAIENECNLFVLGTGENAVRFFFGQENCKIRHGNYALHCHADLSKKLKVLRDDKKLGEYFSNALKTLMKIQAPNIALINCRIHNTP